MSTLHKQKRRMRASKYVLFCLNVPHFLCILPTCHQWVKNVCPVSVWIRLRNWPCLVIKHNKEAIWCLELNLGIWAYILQGREHIAMLLLTHIFTYCDYKFVCNVKHRQCYRTISVLQKGRRKIIWASSCWIELGSPVFLSLSPIFWCLVMECSEWKEMKDWTMYTKIWFALFIFVVSQFSSMPNSWYVTCTTRTVSMYHPFYWNSC